ncbi:hypothetical protein [Zavarzinella formosa]|uniref:hypothetical protein n=1 Tax=Zavarzinella formosa TaxID=360055 RepID=UPI000308F65A|nr:hypothetical protein [Zavarzinella formosa]
MAWVNWSRKPADGNDDRGALGADLNAGRVRATYGRASRNKLFLLEDPHIDLPLAISLEKRTPDVGRAALAVSRKLPHTMCVNYLPQLGQVFEWKHARQTYNADGLVSLALERLAKATSTNSGLSLALPSYLSVPQVTRLLIIAEKLKLRIRGTACTPLALAAERATHFLNAPRPDESGDGSGIHRAFGATSVLIIDVDDHALTASVVRIAEAEVRMLATASFPRLGSKIWRERLLDTLADRCVRLCRRDPRDNADTEQMLFDQLEETIDRARTGQRVSINVRSANWFQDLIHAPADLDAFCAPLARQAAEEIKNLLLTATDNEPPETVWLTHDAGRMPGLAATLHQHMTERTSVRVLHPEATAAAVANLNERWDAAELPRTHLDTVIVLPHRQDPRLLPKAPPPNSGVHNKNMIL